MDAVAGTSDSSAAGSSCARSGVKHQVVQHINGDDQQLDVDNKLVGLWWFMNKKNHCLFGYECG